MAEFEATVCELTIEEHPNADALELARVGNYRSVVRKGQYKTGDLGVYIPEQAVLPEWLIQELGLEGRLAGKEKNRVKAIKLRGVLSQGLIYPVLPENDLYNTRIKVLERYAGVDVGDDVTEELGITKYEPVIPASMSGLTTSAFGMTLKYDIENFKKYPDTFEEGEEVAITEKIHGTWCCFGYHPDFETHIVTSKGLSARGLVFKINEENESNLYLRALDGTAPGPAGTGGNVLDRAHEYVNEHFSFQDNSLPFYILGEVFGKGVQDLHYGMEKPTFRMFDVYIGHPGEGRYLNYYEKRHFADTVNVAFVPVLYVGPYKQDTVDYLTDGDETVTEYERLLPQVRKVHLREGVVITPTMEREDDELGRVIVKSVSEAYLLRKGGTEFN